MEFVIVKVEKTKESETSETRYFVEGDRNRKEMTKKTKGVGNNGRIGNLFVGTQCERGDISQTRRIYFFQSQMDESKPLEKIRHWEHPPWYGRDQVEERVTLTFLEIQKDLFHKLMTHFRLPVKLCTISGPCRAASYTANHVEPRVELSVAERRIIPCSTEVHWRYQNYTSEFGCQAGEAHWWLLEHWWFSRLVWSLDRFHTIYSTRRQSSWRIYVVRGEMNEETAYIQARSSMARGMEVNGKERQAEGKAKMGWRKDSSWQCKKIAWNLFHRPHEKKRRIYFIVLKNVRMKLET